MKKTTGSGITIVLPFIPPSVNDLYFNNRKTGGRTLTKAGQIFKTRVKEHLATNYLDQLQKLNPNSMYGLEICFFLDRDEVFTKSYLDNPDTQSPFKKRDLGNMEKILVDCIREVSMQDDCQVFSENLKKKASPNRRVVVTLIEVEPNEFIEELDPSIQSDIVRKVNAYRNKGKQ